MGSSGINESTWGHSAAASPARKTETTPNPAMSTSSSSVVSSGLVDSALAITREYEALVQPRITYHQYNHTASTGLPVYRDIPARDEQMDKAADAARSVVQLFEARMEKKPTSGFTGDRSQAR